MKNKIRLTAALFRSIPSVIVALFTISVITMNLLANKTLVQTEYIALDGGILVSWISFLCMDVVTKHFGPKAATKLSIFAMLTNLLACFIFFIVAKIPANGVDADYTGFNSIFGGTWFILLSSTIAFFASALINNFLNFAIGKLFRRHPGVAGQNFVDLFSSGQLRYGADDCGGPFRNIHVGVNAVLRFHGNDQAFWPA